MSNEPQPSSADPRENIARSQPADYDGHTEFSRMTPAARLAWLDAAVVFIESRGGEPRQAWTVAEERPEPPVQT
jgi:hypothetical protein